MDTLTQLLSDKIKAKRKQLRITQADLARALNVTQGTVCRWETGVIKISAEDFMKITNLRKKDLR